MKRIIFVPIVFLVCMSCSKNNQSSSTTPPIGTNPPTDTLNSWVPGGSVGGSSDLQDIWFIDNQNGFIISAIPNQLFSSSDGGLNWIPITGTSGFSMINLQFLDKLNGFAQGSNQIESTVDGGVHWSITQLPTGTAINFQFVNPMTGFYNDESTGIYKTVNGSISWNQIVISTGGQQLIPFYFLDTLNGFMMNNGNFSKTIDGGAHWQLVSSNVEVPNFTGFFKMQFLDTLNGFCAGPNGLLKTTDGGITWSNSLNVAAGLMVPYFLDTKNGYCLQNNHIYKTTDGGATWTVSCELVNGTFSGLHFLDMNTGWACTLEGKVLILKP
jgi:photosystem II stability/assembly factor-like uncharacterized protein